MFKKKIFILIITFFSLLLLSFFIYPNLKNVDNNSENVPLIDNSKDALEFKQAYESLNDTKRESDGKTYNNVSIPENNPIKNASATEVVELLKNGTGVIYFGANWCPWCRLIVPTLFEAANQNNINIINYCDISDLSSGFKIEDGKLIRDEQLMSKSYLDLINALDKVLVKETYKLKDESGTSYDTNEKVIYAPLVVVVNNGVITSYHSGAVSLNSDQTKYDTLTDDQKQSLLEMYNKMFETL